MHVTVLECNFDLNITFRHVQLYLPGIKFPVLSDLERCMKSLFGSTYICVQSFSKINQE